MYEILDGCSTPKGITGSGTHVPRRRALGAVEVLNAEGHHGVGQLRIDEARRWVAKATEMAGQGEPGAVAALISLLMGMRASEITSRVARDLDDGGRLLWIPDAKTEAGKRTLQVPEVLQPYLKGLAEGKTPQEKLFGDHWRDWVRKWVKRICLEAKVPQVTAHGMRVCTRPSLSSTALPPTSSPRLWATSRSRRRSRATRSPKRSPGRASGGC